MLMPTHLMLLTARQKKYAVGAFNVYNMEGALSVIQAAEELKSPVMLQILPSALAIGGIPFIKLCLEAGKKAKIPVAVHLDHCNSEQEIKTSLKSGILSVMADGSNLPFEKNLEFTKRMVFLASQYSAGVEGELGKLSGTEDGLSISDRESRLTDPEEAVTFAEKSNVSALAVCIGNIHGTYNTEPQLDFDRLEIISRSVSLPLVLHGTSGLPEEMIEQAMDHGVCKFNVNTEVRYAYLNQMKSMLCPTDDPSEVKRELVEIMLQSMDAMKNTIQEKMRLFRSVNQAD